MLVNAGPTAGIRRERWVQRLARLGCSLLTWETESTLLPTRLPGPPVTVQPVKEFLGLSAGPSQKKGEQFLNTILSNFHTNTVKSSCNAVAMNSTRLVNGRLFLNN